MITNTTHSEGVEKQGGLRKKVKKIIEKRKEKDTQIDKQWRKWLLKTFKKLLQNYT